MRGRDWGAAASGEMGWEGPSLATGQTKCFTRPGNREEDPNDQALMSLAERKFRRRPRRSAVVKRRGFHVSQKSRKAWTLRPARPSSGR